LRLSRRKARWQTIAEQFRKQEAQVEAKETLQERAKGAGA